MGTQPFLPLLAIRTFNLVETSQQVSDAWASCVFAFGKELLSKVGDWIDRDGFALTLKEEVVKAGPTKVAIATNFCQAFIVFAVKIDTFTPQGYSMEKIIESTPKGIVLTDKALGTSTSNEFDAECSFRYERLECKYHACDRNLFVTLGRKMKTNNRYGAGSDRTGSDKKAMAKRDRVLETEDNSAANRYV